MDEIRLPVPPRIYAKLKEIAGCRSVEEWAQSVLAEAAEQDRPSLASSGMWRMRVSEWSSLASAARDEAPDPGPRIRWYEAEDKMVAFSGAVGAKQSVLFRILRPSPGYPDWALTTDFPGQSGKARYADDGPDAVKELKAEAERWLEEYVSSLGASFEVRSEEEDGLPLIGRDLMLVRNLAKQIADKGSRGHALTPLSDYRMAGRGFSFEVLIHEDRNDTRRVAKVSVVLDRVESP